MKLAFSLASTLFASSLVALPQTPAAPADDPVAVVMAGKAWKKSELERLAQSLPTPIAQNYYRDKRAFLENFALMIQLASMAESEGLDKQDPYFFRLYYNRLAYLAQVSLNYQNNKGQITSDDQKKYYEAHKADYSSAQVKAIYIGFSGTPAAGTDPAAKKPLTSAEAEKTAWTIVQKARVGTDFVELVQKYSDDPDSKAKGGDYPPIKPSDTNLPPQIKSAIFALKPGQVSDPISQTNGFWVFRMTEFVATPYDAVRDDVYRAIQNLRLSQWMENFKKSVTVEFKDQSYLDEKSPAK